MSAGGYAPTSINPANSGRTRLPALTAIPGDVCILIDGTKATRLPLSAFHADQVARIEVYAPNSDYSRTIGGHMEGLPGCEPGEGFKHPAYYVIWMRGTN
jgi:hypothetical protein